MVKLPKTIFRNACNEWLKNHRFTDDRSQIPYKYLESKFRYEGYGKKKAFDWIVELSELYNLKFEGNYIYLPDGWFE